MTGIAGSKQRRLLKALIRSGMVDDISPRFSRDGKYIAFLSRRNLAPTYDPIQNHMNLAKDVKVIQPAQVIDTLPAESRVIVPANTVVVPAAREVVVPPQTKVIVKP